MRTEHLLYLLQDTLSEKQSMRRCQDVATAGPVADEGTAEGLSRQRSVSSEMTV